MSDFIARHLGPNGTEVSEMLNKIGVSSLDELIDKTIPSAIRLNRELNVSTGISEAEYLKHIQAIGKQNKVLKSFIGLGYHETLVPSVILRNVLENPGWYTAYTPYQAEIAQGRLEALLNFQTMVLDLTGMEVANASLLDEGTAAAEAMTMTRRSSRSKGSTFLCWTHRTLCACPAKQGLWKLPVGTGHADRQGVWLSDSPGQRKTMGF